MQRRTARMRRNLHRWLQKGKQLHRLRKTKQKRVQRKKTARKRKRPQRKRKRMCQRRRNRVLRMPVKLV